MELKVVSDDGDVLRLQVLARNVQSESPPRFESLEELLGPRRYARLVLMGLAETRFIDSGGLSWLVLCHKRFCQGGGKLIVHSITPAIQELLHMMRLDLALFVAPDEAAALEMVKQGTD
jgi:anti-anti-sigma regulatory factor